MKVRFICLGSGSSGNCYFLGTEEYGILIDAGIGIRLLRKAWKNFGIAPESIHAVFITHDHADHIKSAPHLGEKMHIPIYATPLVHEGINRNYSIRHKLSTSVRYLQKETPLRFKDFRIECFEVPHDGTENVGYCIEIGGKTFAFLTDLGEITPTAARYICKANYLILEANYDEAMLRNGPYPPLLQARIASPTGHLSNAATADFLANHFGPHLRYIWLCHLSHDNNRPELAYQTVEQRLKEKGITVGKDVQLVALKRNTPSEFYTFE